MLTAIHEAGHVVVAHRVGKRVVYVKLGHTVDTGETSCRWDDDEGWTGEKLAAEVSVASAGEVSEMIWHLLEGRHQAAEAVALDGGNLSDRLKAELAATHAEERLGRERAELLSEGRDLAIATLKERWECVLAIAGALQQAGQLDEVQILDLLGRGVDQRMG